MKLIATLCTMILCMALSAQEMGSFTDARDGRVYKTVRIGSQVWMAENLRYSSSNPEAMFTRSTMMSDVFGTYYCWEIALEVCPDGWHLPSDREWETLTDQLGGEAVAGAKMKQVSKYWITVNEEASNKSGFSALPAGYLEYPGDESFPMMGEIGFFWSTQDMSRTNAYFRYVKHDTNILKAGNGDKKYGMSVRCLKD